MSFRKTITFLHLIILFLSITSCKVSNQSDEGNLKDNQTIFKNKVLNNKNKLEIKLSCGKGNLDEFLEKGWKITKQTTIDKVCSWKSVPANKFCNIEEDKGCKITKPDKMGKETIYLMEK
tara:strand:+ start:26 stop:385 length:360 start_codon:yes stop_codon:yes gene_type:complete